MKIVKLMFKLLTISGMLLLVGCGSIDDLVNSYLNKSENVVTSTNDTIFIEEGSLPLEYEEDGIDDGYKQVSGVITNKGNSNLIQDVGIKLVFLNSNSENRYFEAVSDVDGKYSLKMNKDEFSIYSQDEVLIIYAYKDGYIPITTLIKINNSEIFSLNFELEEVPVNMVLLEIEPELHHLGDDSYTGSINSKFQKKTEGTIFTKEFTISSSQANCNEAELTFYARGIQSSYIELNDKNWTISEGPESGEMMIYTLSLEGSDYKDGSDNIISIVSENKNNLGFDDFEFSNIQIEFCPNSVMTPDNNEEISDTNTMMTWYEATNYCATLGGRLPTINELKQNYESGNLEPIDYLHFYWSSDEDPDKEEGDKAFGLYPDNGSQDAGAKDGYDYVKCIKD